MQEIQSNAHRRILHDSFVLGVQLFKKHQSFIKNACPFVSLINLLQLVFSACVAAVKCRFVLYHC